MPQAGTLPQLDMSTSVPLSTPAPSALPKLDMSTSVPLGMQSSGATGGSSTASAVPSALGIPTPQPEPVAPPQDHKEEIVRTIAGDAGLSWYRYGRGVVGQVEQLLEPPKKGDASQFYEKGKDLVKKAIASVPKTAAANWTPDFSNRPVAERPLYAQPIAPAPGVVSALKTAAPDLAAGGAQLVNPFRSILQGAKVAQEPAATAVREASGAAAGTPILEGATTAVDSPISDLGAKKAAAYKQIDNEVGFDWKAENDKLADLQYAIKQPGADVAALQKNIDTSAQAIADARPKLAAKGINPKVADQLNTSWEAGRAYKKAIVSATKADGTINIDSLVNKSKALRFSKYGDRLAQFFGKGDIKAGQAAADEYMAALQDAQKMGAHAMKVQDFAKLVGKGVAGIIGGAALYEGGKAVGQATGALP